MRVEAFFAFMRERENVRLRKEAGDFFPWTKDQILREYKFTNVHRHHDKTSRVLREKFYNNHFDDDSKSILMNCALFRYFGTWEFAEAIGWQDYNHFDFEDVKHIAEQRLIDRQRVFTGAYVITNGGISDKKQNVVCDIYLKGLHNAAPKIVEITQNSNSWEQVGRAMMNLQGFGGSGFMTKEVLLDTTYTGFWGNFIPTKEDGNFSQPADWMNWTPIGPGARRGAARVLGDNSSDPVSEKQAFKVIFDLLEHAGDVDFWPAEWEALCPHDIQFQLCEFDKYERTRLGQGTPRSRYREK